MLGKHLRRCFSATVYPNTPTVAWEYIDGKKHEYDNFYHEYSAVIKAFVERRNIRKKEICMIIRAEDVYYRLCARSQRLLEPPEAFPVREAYD